MDHQRGYWMWAKRKPHWMESWEEAAFAEDASGGLEGCVWPPRCYTCSFCRREFRSAQTLGGHMNVHRRDRARLKQATSEDTSLDVIRVSSTPIPEVKIGHVEKFSSTLCFIPPNVDENIDKGIKVSSDREEKQSVIVPDVVSSCKRIKIDGKPSRFSAKLSRSCIPQLEVMKQLSSSGEDLDLELRLGEAPKVKQNSTKICIL